jgi:hypothetical protein
MRTLLTRAWLVATLAGALAVVCTSAAEASFGVKTWEAGTCTEATCTDSTPGAFYTQAAGHPNFGVTFFEFNNKVVAPLGAFEPEGNVKDVRVDLPPGLAINPEATAQCTEAQIDEAKCPKESQLGEDKVLGTLTVTEALNNLLLFLKKIPSPLPIGAKLTGEEETFPVYNMVRKPGEASRFGIEINSPLLALLGLSTVSYLEGGVSWYREPSSSENKGVESGDYHEYFKIKDIPATPELVFSRLLFWGVPQAHSGVGTPKAFITLPSTCNGPQTTTLHVDSYQEPGAFLGYENKTPVGAEGCNALEFKPTFGLHPETTQSDTPDGAETVLHVPQYTEETARPNSPTLSAASVTLPEGMTLNPSAAKNLEACTNEEFGQGTNNPITCPAKSVLGSVEIEAPGVPNGSLKGSVYLGTQQSSNPESGEEFRMLLAAEAPAYGVGVRLVGHVKANVLTGQLTATFSGSPQIPFENMKLKLNGSGQTTAPLANPLACGPVQASASLTPYSSPSAASATSAPFTVDSDGKGGACASPLSFSLAQVTRLLPETAGAYSAYSVTVSRADGQQYLSKVQATLPPGLLAAIPSIPLCGEPQAAEGACPASSEIGTVAVSAGAGSSYPFTGRVYLTGPYNGAPYGLSIIVPAIAGPFDLGTVKTRATINVDPYTARLIVTAQIPTVFEGVPLRLKSLTMAVTRNNYLFNPTNCGVFATESVLTGVTPPSGATATQSLSTPFQVTGCSSLSFKPTFTATTAAKPTKANGASLNVKITMGAHQANIASVVTQLPKQLPSRLSTLNQACTAATFEANPANCPAGSEVGTATVSTPVLPDKMTGPAYFVSHGNAAFPNLDLVLQADGVKIILVGDTNISKAGVTTSSFSSLPDVPVSSVELNLPVGPHSALTSNGSFCSGTLTMPTTITAQNNAVVKQNTKVTVTGCPVAIVSHKVKGHNAEVTVKAPAAGRVSGSGKNLKTIYKYVSAGGSVKIKVPLSKGGLAKVRKGQTLKIRLRVGFLPKVKGAHSIAYATVIFRP